MKRLTAAEAVDGKIAAIQSKNCPNVFAIGQMNQTNVGQLGVNIAVAIQ